MELHEVGRRIVGRYWWLIALLIITCAAVAGISRSGTQLYTASARIVLDTPDPSTRQESTAIADTVRAIASSPSQVSAALRSARIKNRDAEDVAEHHVSVTGLGSYAVVNLSVSDRDRHVAVELANTLAARVISTRTHVTDGGVPQALAALNERIAELSARISNADAAIDELNLGVANAGSGQQANDLRAKRDAASRRRDYLGQQRGVLESERVNLLGTFALRPKPSVISRATFPLHADSSGTLPYVILGGLLGLVLGLGLAGVSETFRPTVVGGDALARELDTTLLGTLDGKVEADDLRRDLTPIAARVRLAAEAVDVDDVALLPVTADLDLRRFADRLRAHVVNGFGVVSAEWRPMGNREPALGEAWMARRPSSALEIRALSFAAPGSIDDGGPSGLVLVSPDAVSKADVVDVGHLLSVSPMPLLGVITYRSGRLRGLIRRMTRGARGVSGTRSVS
jgi:hypothetical protein